MQDDDTKSALEKAGERRLELAGQLASARTKALVGHVKPLCDEAAAELRAANAQIREMAEALALTLRGIESGRIEDQSFLFGSEDAPNQGVRPLSEVIRATLAKLAQEKE